MKFLGKESIYSDDINPALLEPIPRSASRAVIPHLVPFQGIDLWSCYEFSWLNKNGVPQNKALRFSYPSDSVSIVESKSLKLYLGGFAFSRFVDEEAVIGAISKDLTTVLKIKTIDFDPRCKIPEGRTLNDSLVSDPAFDYDRSLLRTESSRCQEIVTTDLFRSLCPVTGQPDWATITIEYSGEKISEESLLRYLFSLRRHQGFHENCCELIYSDIKTLCQPKFLKVICDFTRRGGISITPIRWSI